MKSVNLRVSSAALTDRGPVRATNQDAFFDRADLGIWAVADGMGGLHDGEIASRMVCDALLDAPQNTELDAQIERVTDQLRAVSNYLRRSATRKFNPIQCGSTVVVLLIRHWECAVLWAGDSRAYRLRDGVVAQLTVDHAWTDDAGGGADSQAITRAVGAEDTLLLEVLRINVRPNDRFLLCSDGVSRVLDTAALAKNLQRDTPVDGCAALVAQSAARGGTDNATAVIVDCFEG